MSIIKPIGSAAISESSALGGIYTEVTSEAEFDSALSNSDALIYISANITFTGNKNITQDTIIYIKPGVTLTLGSSALILSASVHFTIKSEKFSGALITWNRSSGQAIQGGNTNVFILEGVDLTNLSTSANTYFSAQNMEHDVGWFTLTGANASTAGFRAAPTANQTARIRNVKVVAPGASGINTLSVTSNDGAFVDGVEFLAGTYPATTSTAGNFSTNDGVINNIYSEAACTIRVGGVVSNIRATNSSFVLEAVTGSRLSSIDIESGSLDFNTEVLSVSSGRFSITGTLGSGCSFSNCTITNGTAFSGSVTRTRFVGCLFENGLTVPGTANDVQVVGCTADTGTTITIQAGANRTIVSGSQTDTAISDSGTGSVLTGNAVY